jgi:dTDP-4-dehydrorhamnose 3,5-epimerase
MSGSVHAGTLRGLHFQRPPFSEVKLVRCVRGAILDVIVDIRVGSPTYLQWGGFELSADNRRSLYVPQGFAHGFQSLTDDVELYYQVSEYYSPEHEFGLRFDDPALGIDWPRPVTVMSEKDQSWPDFTSDVDFGFRYAASTEDSE